MRRAYDGMGNFTQIDNVHAFGVLVALSPGTGALAILWLIGFYAIVFGVLRLVFAYRMRKDRTLVKSAVRSLGTAAS